MEMLTRKQAIESGLKLYFTGKPCPKGHIAERRIYGSCIECARKDSRDRNNANAKELSIKNIAWRKANAEKVAETSRAYKEANANKVRAWKSANQKKHRAAANARNRKYAETHREELRAKSVEWSKSNPDKVCAKANKYRATKLNQTPKWADFKMIESIYSQAAELRAKGLDVHVDHIVPLQGRNVRGLHVHNNLQIIDAKANRSKSNSI